MNEGNYVDRLVEELITQDKQIDFLNQEVLIASDKLDRVVQSNKDLSRNNIKLRLENDSLKNEVVNWSILRDQDLKEITDLKEQLKVAEDNLYNTRLSRDDYVSTSHVLNSRLYELKSALRTLSE